MTGGLIQIASYGIQDIYLIGNPQITFFKTVYKRHTNFALESIQNAIDGRTDFGQTIQVQIDRKGDLLKDIVFNILLPQLPSGYYYTNGIGNVLAKVGENYNIGSGIKMQNIEIMRKIISIFKEININQYWQVY